MALPCGSAGRSRAGLSAWQGWVLGLLSAVEGGELRAACEPQLCCPTVLLSCCPAYSLPSSPFSTATTSGTNTCLWRCTSPLHSAQAFPSPRPPAPAQPRPASSPLPWVAPAPRSCCRAGPRAAGCLTAAAVRGASGPGREPSAVWDPGVGKFPLLAPAGLSLASLLCPLASSRCLCPGCALFQAL